MDPPDTTDGRRRGATLVAATLVILLFMTMVERTVHALFAVSLASLGASLALLAIPLLFSGFAYPLGLARRWPHSHRALDVCLGVAVLAVLLSLVIPAPLVVLAGAVAVVALTPLLFDAVRVLRMGAAAACVLAVLLGVTLRIANGTAAPGLTRTGVIILAVLALATALAGIVARRAPAAGESEARGLTGVPAMMAFLLVQIQLLGSPSALATLHATPSAGVLMGPGGQGWWLLRLTAACGAGLALGLSLTLGGKLGSARDRALAAAVHLLAVALLVMGIGQPLAPVWIFLAQAAAVVLLAGALSGPGERSIRSAGARVGAVQAAWFVLLLLQGLAARWPLLPQASWPVLQGKATLYLLLSFTLLPIAALTGARRKA